MGCWLSITDSLRELFGTSEDDAPELDHTEDSENGMLNDVYFAGGADICSKRD